jgi:hypothetical protein
MSALPGQASVHWSTLDPVMGIRKSVGKNKKSKRLIDAATVEREATARRAAKAKREPARRRRP